MQANTLSTEPATQERKPLHRVGSLLVKDLDDPKTVGQRIAARRLALGLTQEAVAEQCWITQKSNSSITGRMKGDKIQLSRSAYCMYESDSVAPVLDVLIQIAAALKTTKSYIAFGEGPPDPIEEVTYNAAEDAFEVLDRKWPLDTSWVSENYDAAPHELAAIPSPTFSPSLKPGDIAYVRRGVEPSTAGGEFVYALRGELAVGHVTRPARGGPYRVFDGPKSKRAYIEAEPGEINILGKVVGRHGVV